MRRALYSGIFVGSLFCSAAFAQDRTAGYTGSFFNFTKNAAYAGADENTNLFLDARTVAGSNNLSGSNQNFQFGAQSMFSDNNSLGLKVMSDNQGALRTTNLEAVFAKRFQIATGQYLAFGTNAGFVQSSINTSALTNFVDLSDPTINNGYFNQPRFTAGFGARYQLRNLFDLGVSAPMLVTGNTPINNTLIANASYNIRLGKETAKNKLTPWVIYYYISSQSMVDGGLKLTIHDVVSISGGYRSNGSVLATAFLNAKSFAVGYAFNYSTGQINNLYLGTNELILSLNFASLHHTPRAIDAAAQPSIEEKLQVIKDDLNKASANVAKDGNASSVQSAVDFNNRELRKLLKEYKFDGNDVLKNQIIEIKNIIDKLESQVQELKSKSGNK